MDSVLAIGLMSGTSRRGVDAALIETDAFEHVRPLVFQTNPYSPGVRSLLAQAREVAQSLPIPGPHPVIDEAASVVSSLHLEAIRKLLSSSGFEHTEIEVVGMHGHSIMHRPESGTSWQLGNGLALATESRINVVSDFVATDQGEGGCGGPLLPVFYRALMHEEAKPAAVLDLGETARLTAHYSDRELGSLEVGPGTRLLDAWMQLHFDKDFDEDGAMSARGTPDEDVIEELIAHPYFRKEAPKSVDLDIFSIAPVRDLSPEDGAATLAAFTAECVVRGLLRLAQRPDRFWVAGGGRKNATLLRMIASRTGISARPIDKLGWNGDALDAQGYAYLAVRRVALKSSTYPETTGVKVPAHCGKIHIPLDRRSVERNG